MFCSKCGNKLAKGSAFCSKCGNPVGFSPTQPIQENQVSNGSTTENLSKETDPAKKKKRKVIISIVIMLLVAAIGVAAAFATDGFGLLGNSSSNEGIEESDASTVDSSEEAGDTESNENNNEIRSSLEEYTWEELSAISAEIATASDEGEAIEIAKTYNLVNEDGTLDGTQTKSVTLTDGTETSVQIAGFAHDDKSDGSGKAGITFIFTDAIATHSMNSDGYNTGGWESSEMRSWLASDGKALLPKELQNVLVSVDKFTNNVGESGDVSSIATTSDGLWLFSFVELAGEVEESDFYEGYEYLATIYNVEGSQYKLFSDRDVDPWNDNDILEKTYEGDSCYWWGRSPDPDYSVYFRHVNSDGYLSYGISADLSGAVVPGFCI